jgi:flagellar basal-body rod modification protein FlgD
MSSMSIADLLGATPSNTARSATSSTSTAKNGFDQDTFMTLLVAQLKNQDPLAPQDSTQFIAQLAQLNSLDQLININKRLDQLVNQTQQTQTGNQK